MENLEQTIQEEFTKTEIGVALVAFSQMWIDSYYETNKVNYKQVSDEMGRLIAETSHSKYREPSEFFTDNSPRNNNSVSNSDAKIGSECKRNVDCISGNCCDGICRDFLYESEPCKYDCECASEKCINNVCVFDDVPD